MSALEWIIVLQSAAVVFLAGTVISMGMMFRRLFRSLQTNVAAILTRVERLEREGGPCR